MTARTVSVGSEAEEELAAAAIWYERKREGLGQHFLRAVRNAIARAAEDPSCWSPIARVDPALSVKRVLVNGFPYSVVLLPIGDEIRVLAFQHARRHPGYWLGREPR